MANETQITVVGRLTEDVDLKYTGSNLPVANVTIASNPRKFDRDSNEWTDEPAAFWRASGWRELAEHMATTLRKGMEVIVVANVKNKPYKDKNTGQERSSLELDIIAIGPNLRTQTAQVERAQTNRNQQENRTQYPQQQQQPQQVQQQAPAQQQQGQWLPPTGGGQYTDETPF